MAAELAGAAAAANPYLAAAGTVMSGLAGMGQQGPMQGYGGTQTGGNVSVGGLNVPARPLPGTVAATGPGAPLPPGFSAAGIGLLGLAMLGVLWVSR